MASSGLIAGLADTTMYPCPHKQSLVKAKKLDANNDGLISLEELIRRENLHNQKLDRKKDSQGDEAEFNARLVVMFKRMDRNNDGVLDDIEISELKHHHSKSLNSRRSHEKQF